MSQPTILFDAGNTVILEQPGETLPMVSWKYIEMVPGIDEALRALHPIYCLVIASNADVSTGAMALQALARLSLDGYFSHVFTSVDLKVQKPNPAFFQSILQAVEAEPQDAVMVGDTYRADILGGKSVGLRTVWYNPHKLEAPGGHPEQDAEVAEMRLLPQTLSRPTLPDIPTCTSWLVSEGADERLLRHVRAVAIAAYHLACRLRKAGTSIDPLLTHRGALLHDLDKVTFKAQGVDHGEHAARLLKERGWPELAEIARRHILRRADHPANPITMEEKVVNYADKVVEGDQWVGLEARVQALMQRYPTYAGEMETNLPHLRALEEDLCRQAGIRPASLFAELQESWPGDFH